MTDEEFSVMQIEAAKHLEMLNMLPYKEVQATLFLRGFKLKGLQNMLNYKRKSIIFIKGDILVIVFTDNNEMVFCMVTRTQDRQNYGAYSYDAIKTFLVLLKLNDNGSQPTKSSN